MNEKYLSNVRRFLIASIAPATVLISQLGLAKASSANTFSVTCQTQANDPTIVADFTGSQGKQEAKLLTFLPEYFSSQAAESKCQAAANTLQSLYASNGFNYLASDFISDRPVICAVERRGVGCNSYSAKILFDLDRQANPAEALYNMLGEEFKKSEIPQTRTVSRIYTDLTPNNWWWPF